MWLIDGNKLKEKAVPLLFPTEMEPCGHLPVPVQAITVAEIENMMCRESVEVVLCRYCKHYHADTLSCDFTPHAKYYGRPNWYEDDFCSYGEQKGG